MIERIEGIVTDIVRHNDAHNVVTLYTRSRGRMAFLVTVGKSKGGRLRNSLLSLMAVVGADVNIREGKELYTLRQVQPLRLWHGIYAHPLKSAILFFITEFCHRLLRQYPADERLWQYITDSLETLDSCPARRLANFHITFIVKMLPLVGVEPSDVVWSEGMVFDMLSGEMIDRDQSFFIRRRVLLSEPESEVVPLLSRINFRNMHYFRFSRDERRRVVERLLGYYNLHLSLDTNFKSLPVLTEFFS